MTEIDDTGQFSNESLGMGHAHHGTVVHSSRQFEHAGHDVEIRATYRVLVNGVERQLQFSVGPDGKVTTHLRPYVAYDSLVEMVRDVIDNYPDSFSGDAPPNDSGHGGGHDHA